MGPKKDKIWDHFECSRKPNNTGLWATCKKCKWESQGIIDRLQKHHAKCETEGEPEASCSKKSRSSLSTTRDQEVIYTSADYKKKLDMLVAEYFYSTNTPFERADHESFRKLVSALRPGYTPPSQKSIGGPLLDQVYTEIRKECAGKFKASTVTMQLDGWSNVNKEPIVATFVSDVDGNQMLFSSIDFSGKEHTAENLAEMAEEEIQKCELELETQVGSFVTDNTGNVRKMRGILEDNVGILQYGCTAHILNLLSQDVAIPAVGAQVIKIIKYFRNHQLPAAWYKAAGGKQLPVPIEVRWNTINDSIKAYLSNRGYLVQVCQDHRSEIKDDIYQLVNDLQLSNLANEYKDRMFPIAVALDRSQRDSTTIAVAVEIFGKLEKDLKDEPRAVKEAFKKRKKMALTPAHFLANILDHRFRGKRLTDEEKASAFVYLKSIDPQFQPLVMCHMAGSMPFLEFQYDDSLLSAPPLTWWKSVSIQQPNAVFDWGALKEPFLKLSSRLLSAAASTAGIERLFSTYGFVLSKLRNRLGHEKAMKLTFIYRFRNHQAGKGKTNLKWVYSEEGEETDPPDPVVPEGDEEDAVDLVDLVDDD